MKRLIDPFQVSQDNSPVIVVTVNRFGKHPTAMVSKPHVPLPGNGVLTPAAPEVFFTDEAQVDAFIKGVRSCAAAVDMAIHVNQVPGK